MQRSVGVLRCQIWRPTNRLLNLGRVPKNFLGHRWTGWMIWNSRSFRPWEPPMGKELLSNLGLWLNGLIQKKNMVSCRCSPPSMESISPSRSSPARVDVAGCEVSHTFFLDCLTFILLVGSPMLVPHATLTDHGVSVTKRNYFVNWLILSTFSQIYPVLRGFFPTDSPGPKTPRPSPYLPDFARAPGPGRSHLPRTGSAAGTTSPTKAGPRWSSTPRKVRNERCADRCHM